MDHMPVTVTGTNIKGAVFSFLRVLAVALASAVIPFVTSPQSDDVPTRAIVYAVLSATLLTVINFLRPGETRFGTTTPNVVRGDTGRTLLGTIGVVLIVLAVCLALLTLLGAIAVSLLTALIVGLVGLALILVDGNV